MTTGQFVTTVNLVAPVIVIPAGTDVAPPGYAIRTAWNPAAGADRAEVDTGAITVTPATALVSLGTLSVAQAGDAVEVVIPGAPTRVRSLTLSGLKMGSGSELKSETQLSNAGLRLTILQKVADAWTPLAVVPALGARGVLPDPLRGAAYGGGLLTLPDPLAARLRLQLVSGDEAESLNPQTTHLSAAQGTAAVVSRGLELVAPDGSIPWSNAGELPAAGQSIDPRVPLRLALEAALAAGAPPDITLRLRGPAGVRAWIAVTPAHGALVRRFSGALTAEVGEREPPLPLPAGAPALAAETPASAVADVTVRYAGVRLHASVRDPVPVAAGAVGGPVVGDAPVLRALPAAALQERPLARAAPIGRAPDGCQLSATLVDMTGGRPLGPPGTLQIEPGAALAAHWVEMPACDAPAGAPGLSLQATAGRFLWAAAADGTPLASLAVHDPDPGGRPVLLAGATLTTVTSPEVVLPAHPLPVAALRGPAAPRLGGELFCTVELADLTLRYAR